MWTDSKKWCCIRNNNNISNNNNDNNYNKISEKSLNFPFPVSIQLWCTFKKDNSVKKAVRSIRKKRLYKYLNIAYSQKIGKKKRQSNLKRKRKSQSKSNKINPQNLSKIKIIAGLLLKLKFLKHKYKTFFVACWNYFLFWIGLNQICDKKTDTNQLMGLV